MEWYEACLRVAAIFLGFALIHSLLVTGDAKADARKLLGERFVRAYYRLFYTALSAATTLFAVYLITRIPDVTLFSPPLWLRIICHAIQLAGVVTGFIAFRNISTWEFMGVSQAVRALAGREQQGDDEGLRQSLVTTGIYARVRHPLYLAGILIFTFNPYITRNWLTVSVLADLYFLLGALLEERRLLARFGDEYREYMRRVPRLIPKIF